MLNLTNYFFAFFLLLPTLVFSQTSPPIGAMPMQYNGSFAGSAGNARISSFLGYYSSHLKYTDEKQLHAGLSFDRFYPGLRSGIGITVKSKAFDERRIGNPWRYQTVGAYSSITLDIAPKISINGKLTLSPSISFSYQGYYFDIHEDNPNLDPVLDKGYSDGMTSRMGLLVNANRYYVGCSFYLFTTTFNRFRWEMFRPQIQLGYTFQKSEDSRFSFTPQLAVGFGRIGNPKSAIVHYVNYNLGFRYQKLIASIIGYDYLPSGFQLGWQKGGWRIVTTHEFYHHNYQPVLSLRYFFNQRSIHIYRDNF